MIQLLLKHKVPFGALTEKGTLKSLLPMILLMVPFIYLGLAYKMMKDSMNPKADGVGRVKRRARATATPWPCSSLMWRASTPCAASWRKSSIASTRESTAVGAHAAWCADLRPLWHRQDDAGARRRHGGGHSFHILLCL